MSIGVVISTCNSIPSGPPFRAEVWDSEDLEVLHQTPWRATEGQALAEARLFCEAVGLRVVSAADARDYRHRTSDEGW